MCKRKNQTIYAKIGGGDLSSAQTKMCVVQETFMAEFNPYSFENDIALVKIGCQHQQVIQISTINTMMVTESRNFECLIYGYGSLSYDTNSTPTNLLYYGNVVPISHRDCESIIGRAVAPVDGSSQFCARGKTQDACNGSNSVLCVFLHNAFLLHAFVHSEFIALKIFINFPSQSFFIPINLCQVILEVL
jgi:hypothetical protein